MAFKASKERKRREQKPVGRGKPIIPSAALREWYSDEIMSVVKPMIAEYRAEIKKALETPAVEATFAQDAAARDILNIVLKRLNRKWSSIFEGFAQKVSREFVDRADEQATAASLHSLSIAGIDQPRARFTELVSNTLGAATDFNHTLITNVQKEVHEKVFESVMLSLTSPDPAKQGMTGIENSLKEIGGFSKKRVDLITRDQTAKLYTALSDERMVQNGVEEFEWQHSSAGKVPRHSHQLMNGHVFKLNDPRLWTVGGEFDLKKGDLGPPGWAINCRCRKIPIIR